MNDEDSINASSLAHLWEKNLTRTDIARQMELNNGWEIQNIWDPNWKFPCYWEKMFGKEEIQNLRKNPEWVQKINEALHKQLERIRNDACYDLIRHPKLSRIQFMKFLDFNGNLKDDPKTLSSILWGCIFRNCQYAWRIILPKHIILEYLKDPPNALRFKENLQALYIPLQTEQLARLILNIETLDLAEIEGFLEEDKTLQKDPTKWAGIIRSLVPLEFQKLISLNDIETYFKNPKNILALDTAIQHRHNVLDPAFEENKWKKINQEDLYPEF